MRTSTFFKLSTLVAMFGIASMAHAATETAWTGPMTLRTEAPLKVGAMVEAIKTDDGTCFYKGKVNIQKPMNGKTALKWVVTFTTLVCKNENDVIENVIKGEATLKESLAVNDSLEVTITP